MVSASTTRHRFADETHAIRRQQRPIGLRRGTAVGARKADAAGDRRNIRQIGGGEDRNHTGHRARRRRIDAGDRGVRMMRAHQHRMQHAGWMRVSAL